MAACSYSLSMVLAKKTAAKDSLFQQTFHVYIGAFIGGSIISMSFIGSNLAVPHYHVMGPAKASLEASSRYLARELGPDNIRVNVVSSGAIKTLSSAGIKDFAELMRVGAEHSAMKRTVTQE